MGDEKNANADLSVVAKSPEAGSIAAPDVKVSRPDDAYDDEALK